MAIPQTWGMDAVKDLTFDLKSGWYGYVVDADIKGFLDGDEAIVNPSVNRGGCNTKVIVAEADSFCLRMLTT